MTIRSSRLVRDVEIFGEDPWGVLAAARRELLERLQVLAAVARITDDEEGDFELALASRRETFEQMLHRSGLEKREFGALLTAFAREGLK